MWVRIFQTNGLVNRETYGVDLSNIIIVIKVLLNTKDYSLHFSGYVFFFGTGGLRASHFDVWFWFKITQILLLILASMHLSIFFIPPLTQS